MALCRKDAHALIAEAAGQRHTGQAKMRPMSRYTLRIFAALVFAALPEVCRAQPSAAADTVIRPFTIRVPDAVLADLKTRLKSPRVPESLNGDGWTYGTDTTLSEAARRLLARSVRLAGSGAIVEPLRAVHDEHRRPDAAFHSPPLEAAERAAAAHHARLARIVRRVREGDRSPHRSGRPWRTRGGCIRRRHPVDSRLCVLGKTARAWLLTGSHCRARSEADGEARLSALRRAGRRLGFDHRDAGRAQRRAARGGPAPQHVHRRRATR